MKKRHLMAAIATAIGIAGGAALAAELNPSQIGSSCGVGEEGTWHFVWNQTRGAGPGTLTAVFAGAGVVTVPATMVNRNNQHFFIGLDGDGPAGPLLAAYTADEGGNLVLSDLDCEGKKPPPPPPCDPKKDPDCEPPK